ncbi:MAG: DUF4493 domain-containing protein [Alistipes sp.]|nr:DUF4493 domain-containing protein [Alistipes sp.]
MKTFVKYLFPLLAVALMAAGCGKDSLPVDNEQGGTDSEKGILCFANWNLDVVSDSEIISTDKTPLSLTRTATQAPDTYLIKIYNSKKQEVGSYTYAEIKAQERLELPQDTYTITAESPNYASIADAAWEDEDGAAYYGYTSATVIKRQQTNVTNLTARLANIKTTVAISAELNSLFKQDDDGQQLTTTLSIGDNSLVFGRAETTREPLKAGFFRAVEENNTLRILLKGLYNKAAEGEAPQYVPVNWSQELINVSAGQWRKISIKILNADKGNVQIGITVETWVYDERIDVDVMSAQYSFTEEEIFDEEVSDENSPVLPLENNHDIAQPFRITTEIFDFDVASCSDMISAVVTPAAGSTVASLEAVFDSDSEAFLAALAAAGYANNTVSFWPGENAAGTYCVVKESGSSLLVKVNYAGMKGLYDFPGTHTAKFIAVDSEGRRSYTTMTILVSHSSGSDEGPGIVWEGSDFGQIHILPEGGALDVVINITSATGLTGLNVEIDSNILDEETLTGVGLAPSLDLVNPGSTEGVLQSLKFPTGAEVVGNKNLTFDISEFMPMIYGLAQVNGKSGYVNFKLIAADASGRKEATIQLRVTIPTK